jgi:hypothetical protein
VKRNGGLHYLGRIDSQVKVRGHRVELQAIEAALCGCDGVREAACTLQDDRFGKTLVACLVATNRESPPQVAAILETLRAVLPEHAIPARFTFLSGLPVTTGGKLNRAALPQLAAQPRANGAPPVASATWPADDLERVIAEGFAEQLPASHIERDADFFALGGDSLRAAQMISELRRNPATALLAVRDVYEARTVRGLAARVRQHEQRRASAVRTDGQAAQKIVNAAAPAYTHTGDSTTPAPPATFTFTAFQCAYTSLVVLVQSAMSAVAVFFLLPWFLLAIGPVALVVFSPLFSLAGLAIYTAASLAFSVALKRVLIGEYRATRQPVWGGFHLRNWVVQRAVRLVPW